MKKSILLAVMFVIMSCSMVFAEASFDQIQGLIKEKNYSAAVSGLEGIIQNHPKSAKAYYAMSQAQAGLGDQVKAKKALDIATGLDPKLGFASSGNVENLKEAIQPQTKKIEAVESHTMRNCMLIVLFGSLGFGAYLFFRKEKKEEKLYCRDPEKPYTPPAYKAPNTVTEPVKTYQESTPNLNANYSRTSYNDSPKIAPTTYNTPPVNHTTVVNNSNNDGILTGVLIGSMLNNNNHDHSYNHTPEREVVIEREVIREVPVYTEPTRSSSWDNDDRPSSSSSWDSTPSSSSSSSSSWDSSSSSSSSSSWDSGSSSSSDSGSWD